MENIEGIERALDEIRQLEAKKGPYYDKWLLHYKQAVVGHCVKIAERYNREPWLEGMEIFLKNEQQRRKAVI